MNLLPSFTFSKAVSASRATAITLILIIFIGTPSFIRSQGVVVPADGSKPVKGAAPGKPFDKGVMFPRVTIGQRDSIISPAEGIVIYNTEAKKPQFYDGTAWKYFDMNPPYIGEEYGGGIIFFIDASGKHGLIVAPADLKPLAKWGFFEKPVGADGKTMGTGKSNTDKIAKISPMRDIAAILCSNLQLNGFSDWFLPSIDELNLIYQNLKVRGLGNLADDEYWSSSETDFNNAWLMNFGTGHPYETTVDKAVLVRAVRSVRF